jgi:hypothetical protein
METRITQEFIKRCNNLIKDIYGVYDEELAKLEFEDAIRKGCLIEYGPYCTDCPHYLNNTCPVLDWQKRHPEFANDELDQKIKTRLDELHKLK